MAISKECSNKKNRYRRSSTGTYTLQNLRLLRIDLIDQSQ